MNRIWILALLPAALMIAGCNELSRRAAREPDPEPVIKTINPVTVLQGSGAEEFLDLVKTYGAAKTFSGTSTWTMVANRDQKAVSERMLFYVQPNKFRFVGLTGSIKVEAVSDGKTLTESSGRSAEQLWPPAHLADASSPVIGDFQWAGSVMHKILGGPGRILDWVDASAPISLAPTAPNGDATLSFVALAPYGTTTIVYNPTNRVIKSIESRMEPQVKETLERGGTTNGGILESMIVTERFSNLKLDTAIEPAAFIPNLAPESQIKDSRTERTSVEKLKGWTGPKFDLAVYSGGRQSVGPVKGKVVLLDFWSTWRETCKVTVPLVQSIKQWAGDDLEVFSICPEPTEKVKIWKQAMNMPTFSSVVDPELKACKAYGLVETVAKRETVAVPSVVVIGTDGRIVDIITEFQTTEPIIRAMLRGGFPVEKLIRTQASGSSGRKEPL